MISMRLLNAIPMQFHNLAVKVGKTMIVLLNSA